MLVGIRTLVNPSDPKDVEEAHALQDAGADSACAGAAQALLIDDTSFPKPRFRLLCGIDGVALCRLTLRG